MKTKKILLWPFLLGISLWIMTGCDLQTSYSEGPAFSVRPAKDRVINTWEWAYALENDYNRTGELSDSTIEFLADGALKICHEDGGCREGSWNLITKRTKLQIVFGRTATAYDIFMLKENEMWIRLIEGSEETIQWELVTKE